MASDELPVTSDATSLERAGGDAALEDSSAATDLSTLFTVEEPDLDGLEERLGVAFKNRGLLRQALIHKSLTNDLSQSGLESNERLEFLGDAIVGATVAEHLYRRFPDHDEGQLTLLRSALVRTSTLASWARDLDLGSFVLVGRGEARGGGRDREPLLASTFEAIVGAVYLDRGFRAARQLVQRFAAQDVARLADRPVLDAKSRLQQVSQALYAVTPTYEVLDVSGLGHSPIFTVQVTAGGGIQTTAEGRSKQIAQQTAAAEALAILEQELGITSQEPGDDSRLAADS